MKNKQFIFKWLFWGSIVIQLCFMVIVDFQHTKAIKNLDAQLTTLQSHNDINYLLDERSLELHCIKNSTAYIRYGNGTTEYLCQEYTLYRQPFKFRE